MQHWEEPRPLFPWSPRPEPLRKAAPRLRPNLYAKLARFSVQNPAGLVLLTLFLLAAALTFTLVNGGSDDEDAGGMLAIGSHPASQRLHAEFPAAETAVIVRVGGNDAGVTKAAAGEIAAQIGADRSVIDGVYVPGVGPFYERYGVYYLDPGTISERIDRLRRARSWLDRLSSSPNLSGLVDVVKQASVQGSDAASLSDLFFELSSTIGDIERGDAAAMDWMRAAGLDLSLQSRTWAIVVVPKTGAQSEARRRIKDAIARVSPEAASISFAMEARDSIAAKAVPPSTRKMAVGCFLAVLFLGALLTPMTGGLRNAVLIMVPALAAVVAGMALASVFLEQSVQSRAFVVLAIALPCIVAASLLATAFSHHEARASSRQSLVMLAAQQAGPLAAATLGLASVTWLTWLVSAIDLQIRMAEVVAGALVCGGLACFLLLPCLAKVLPSLARKDETVPLKTYLGALGARARRLRAMFSLLLLAISLASAVFFVSAEPRGPAIGPADALHVIAKDQAEAEKAVIAIGKLPFVQQPYWIQSMLPRDVAEKQAELLRLKDVVGPVASSLASNEGWSQALSQLEQSLTALAAEPTIDEVTKAAALELRRGITLLINGTAYPDETGRQFEQLVFKGLGEFQPRLDRLAALPPPQVKDLDPGVRALFVSASGAYRIEVRPNAPMPARNFLARLRAVSPDVQGGAVVETAEASQSTLEASVGLLAAMCALLAVSFILLRDMWRWLPFAASQLASCGLFAGCLLLSGLGLMQESMAAVTMAFAVCAAAAFISMGRGSMAWASTWSLLIGPLAGIAMVAPAIFLRMEGMTSLANLCLLLFVTSAGVQLILLPQLVEWVGRIRGPKVDSAMGMPLKQTGDKPSN